VDKRLQAFSLRLPITCTSALNVRSVASASWVKTNIHDTRGNNLRFLALWRELHEGLNVIEQWNGANDFVFFARRGELVSNHREDHEVSMLALHLLQNCMVYINTLMLQQVLAQPHWGRKLTPRDLSALTPLIWEHVNPCGRFELDMGFV